MAEIFTPQNPVNALKLFPKYKPKSRSLNIYEDTTIY
jgi:hypothetical protein